MTSARRIVLVVEDDDDLRRMFGTALKLAGFEVHEASNGHAALVDIEQQRPAAIVLDIRLPKMNGHQVIEEVVGQAHTRHIPIVVVTADPAFTATAHVACLLRKPVDPDRLVSTVQACIASSTRPRADFP